MVFQGNDKAVLKFSIDISLLIVYQVHDLNYHFLESTTSVTNIGHVLLLEILETQNF